MDPGGVSGLSRGFQPVITFHGGGVAYIGTPDGGWTEIGQITTDVRYELITEEPVEPFSSWSWSTGASSSFTFKSSRISLAGYWLLFRRRHPRARAMHCAYSRRLRVRRKRGAR